MIDEKNALLELEDELVFIIMCLYVVMFIAIGRAVKFVEIPDEIRLEYWLELILSKPAIIKNV